MCKKFWVKRHTFYTLGRSRYGDVSQSYDASKPIVFFGRMGRSSISVFFFGVCVCVCVWGVMNFESLCYDTVDGRNPANYLTCVKPL